MRVPETAMVLAAGQGKRMRPISATTPKPLVRIGDRALIDHCLDGLAEAGVKRAVVNVRHLADQIVMHLKDRPSPKVTISDETDAELETGGGVKRALPLLGHGAFLLRNSDSFWLEGVRPNLQWLAGGWDESRMDGLLLLASTVKAVGYSGRGDFTLDADGRLARRQERRIAPFVYAGAAIFSPKLFANSPEGRFSLNVLFDQAIEAKRLFGVRLDGIWISVENPGAIEAATRAIAASAA
jgi:MurNAc alpha-1-phosphate uridylyltransferase